MSLMRAAVFVERRRIEKLGNGECTPADYATLKSGRMTCCKTTSEDTLIDKATQNQKEY